jgi:hypothetical protein
MSDTTPEAAARLARGQRPSDFIAGGTPAPQQPEDTKPFDPLRLCIFATISLLGWVFGPLAVVVFAGVGFAGYWKARQAGLTRSRCYLRDTRLVLAYLFALAAAGAWGLVLVVQHWLA